MKTREDEIRIASTECYLEEVKQMDTYLGQAEEWTKGITFGFIKGAKWADKTMIDKACQWLGNTDMNNFEELEEDGNYYFNYKRFINAFKKAMEE